MSLSIEKGISLKSYCTFSIGGSARYFTVAQTLDNLKDAIAYAKFHKLPFFILGKGSNILFDDKGFNGLVIRNKIADLKIEGNQVEVGAGYSFSLLGTKTARMGLEGLEFASGIPGTVGGAVFMNAGANGAETRDCLSSVSFLDENGHVKTYQKDELEFSYRYSSFHQMKGSIVSAHFILHPSDSAKKRQVDFINYRMRTQPYGEHSAGCTFKNLDSKSVGQLIDECGLKGFSIGGAQISDLHGNFIINTGDATAQNVLDLIQHIQNCVQEKGFEPLTNEIRYIPYAEGEANE
ncbi:UDP-N-acetylenolpyruvoylglucosamine reductase [Chlamydiales bacterium SCGC AG-110-M15]|nr:UDP-N-acetylenolpyruvoylglucosamine reductase [Chlamydiales bacterium SCGC AG-110-M15]